MPDHIAYYPQKSYSIAIMVGTMAPMPGTIRQIRGINLIFTMPSLAKIWAAVLHTRVFYVVLIMVRLAINSEFVRFNNIHMFVDHI